MLDIEKIKPNIKKLAKKYNLSLVILIGSQVTGKTHFDSDIDIAFISEKKNSLLDISKMQLDFTKELKMSKIELVDLKQTSPIFLKQALDKSVVLYEKEKNIFDLFKIYSFKMFIESKKLIELRNLSFNKFLKKGTGIDLGGY